MKLWLVVRQDGQVAEACVVSHTSRCWEGLVPKREPDIGRETEKVWVIAPDRRRFFVGHAIKWLEKFNQRNGNKHSAEVLDGFFGMVGLGSRWVNNEDVDWCLFLGDRALGEGDAV